MPNTSPVNDSQSITEFIFRQAKIADKARVFPIGAITKGSKGEELAEIGELYDAGCVAISDDGIPVMNTLVMRRAMEYARTFDLPVIDHCEDMFLSTGGSMNEGFVSTELGIPGIPNAAEEVMVARNIFLAELTQSRLHLPHVSTIGSVRLLRDAKERGLFSCLPVAVFFHQGEKHEDTHCSCGRRFPCSSRARRRLRVLLQQRLSSGQGREHPAR